ncbi:MAG: alpha/beta fold hydrolase [Thermoleophilaceae bacterium]
MGGALDGDFGGTFPYESRYLEAPGGRIAYVDEGPRDSAPLLMLHGNGTWSYMYRRPIATLSDRGHRCVALDHMGFGRSHKPRHLHEYTLDAHIANTVHALDALDLRDVTLAVHDWGGPIGLGAALERRERVRALVVMNSWAWELPSFLPPFVREFRTGGLGEILALGGNLLVECIPGGMASRDTDPVMMDAYRAPFPDYWSRLGMLAFQRDIPITERDGSAPRMAEIHAALPTLELPLLLVWGMRDPVFRPVFLTQWRELFADARAVELDDAAHYLVEDQPDAVTGAIGEFLAEP